MRLMKRFLKREKVTAEVSIRSALPDDAVQLGMLASELALMNGFLLSSGRAAAIIEFRLKFPDYPVRIMVAANSQDTLLGYVAFQDTYRTSYGEIYRHVTELVVSKDMRRQGIAEKLLSALESTVDLRQIPYIRIDALPTNTIARRAYGRMGFSEQTTIAFFKKLSGAQSS